MSATPATVLLLHTRTQLSRSVEDELSRAGFDVARVMDPRALVEAARRRRPAAVLVPELLPRGVWNEFRSDPDLRRIRVVSLSSGRPLALWPLAVLVRADATLTAADLRRRDAAGDALRAAIARGGKDAPTRRELLGDGMWRAASVLRVLALVLLLFVSFARPQAHGWLLGTVLVFCATSVLEDTGGPLALGRRPGLRWLTWVWIAFAGAAVVLAIGSG